MLKDKVEYEPLSVGEYEKRYEAQQTCVEPVETSNISKRGRPSETGFPHSAIKSCQGSPGTPTQKAASRGDRLLGV